MNNIYNILFQIGTMSGCHQLPERSFYIRKKQMPVCARCFGVSIGYFLSLISALFIKHNLGLMILLCLPLLIDWSIQEMFHCESNNIRRLLTGVLCGYGFNSLHIEAIRHLLRALKII